MFIQLMPIYMYVAIPLCACARVRADTVSMGVWHGFVMLYN